MVRRWSSPGRRVGVLVVWEDGVKASWRTLKGFGGSDSSMRTPGGRGRYGEILPPPWFINEGILLHAGNAPRSPWITGVGGLGALVPVCLPGRLSQLDPIQD